MRNLRFTFRMLKRNPMLIFISLPSLAIGLAAVLLLLVYLNNEISFDQHFKTKDRVVRLYNDLKENGENTIYGICLRKSYTDIPSQIPEVEAATQIFRGWDVNVKQQEDQFQKVNLLYADPGFFEVFGQELLVGNKADALKGENTVVLSESTALKIFQTIDCIGKNILISDEPFLISGVMEDLPKTTHFNFDLLASMKTLHPGNYGGLEFFSYYLIDQKADPMVVGEKISQVNNRLMEPWKEGMDAEVHSGVELLKDLHLHTKVDFDLSQKANLTSIGIVIGIAVFILLIALINFLNLYILHGEKRISEIASRKSIGADVGIITRMFYTETGIIGVIAFLLALVLLFFVQPSFAHLMQRPLEFSDLLTPTGLLLSLVILAVVVLISGAYPSFYLAKLNLVNGLKGKTGQIKRKNRLSMASVLVQFSITVFLISSLFIVQSQVNYLKNMPLGFNPQGVVGFNSYSSSMRRKYTSIEDDLRQLPFVKEVASSQARMGGGGSGQTIKLFGSTDKSSAVDEYRIHPGFCETMQFHLQNGRFFREGEADKNTIILNQSAAELLHTENLVGKQIDFNGKPMTVVGVVDNFFHVDHPGDPITPLILTNYTNYAYHCYIRTGSNLTFAQLSQVAAILKQYDPEYIFSSYELNDVYTAKFESENRVMNLVKSGTWLAILISFVGLVSLSLLNVNRRRKEIGIRKVVGSSISEVMFSIVRQYILLVLASTLLAALPAYLLMQEWLKNFSERIPLQASYFLLSGLFALVIALLAVSFQSWKAATRNPVEALRYE